MSDVLLRLASLREIAEELLRRAEGDASPARVSDDTPRGNRKGVEKRAARAGDGR